MTGRRERGLLAAPFVVGIGLSGFFDGILLHQVLQWHHLLSLVPGEAFRDLGTQILADGLFHVLMYGVTAAGLWMVWRRRAQLARGGWRPVAGGGLLGFGTWNVIDVGFFHWILGIHRIRVDVSDPLTYDLGWLGLFGLVPLAIGWAILRRPEGGSGGAGAAAALSLMALIAAPLAALPQPNSDSALVLLGPGATAADAVNLAQSAGAPALWIDPDGQMMAVAIRGAAERRLYEQGAWLVTRSPVLAGCAASLRAA